MAGCRRGGRRRREETTKTYDPEPLQRRLVQFKMAQTITCFVFLIFALIAVGRTTAHNLWTTLLILGSLVMTGVSQYVCGLKGPNLSGCMIASIIFDVFCLVFQLNVIICIFVSGALGQCFGKTPQESSCGLVVTSLVVSNILLSSYIHTFVRAAILINILKCQRKQQLPVSTRDENGEPPAYPSDENPPSYSNIDLGLYQADGTPACKGGSENAPAASSAALTELMTLPDVSDDDDDGREDRPLLSI